MSVLEGTYLYFTGRHIERVLIPRGRSSAVTGDYKVEETSREKRMRSL